MLQFGSFRLHKQGYKSAFFLIKGMAWLNIEMLKFYQQILSVFFIFFILHG